MSNKSRTQKWQKQDALAKIPEGSIASLIPAHLAENLSATDIRLLSREPIGQIMTSTVTATMWHGPLPPPEQLMKFNDACPGAAEIILKMAHTQALHRQALETIVIPEQQRQSARGQIFAFIIGMSGIIGSVVTALYGHELVASSLAIGSLSVLGMAFLGAKVTQSKQMKQKDALPASSEGG